MAIWVDILHLEPPSDEEDNDTESGCYVSPTNLHFSSEASLQDHGSHQDHATTTPVESAPYAKIVCSVNGFKIPALKVSTSTRSSASVYHEHDRQDHCNMPQLQDRIEEKSPCPILRKRHPSAKEKPEHCNVHGITFRITSPDDTTVTIPSIYEEETSGTKTADTKSAQIPLPFSISESCEDSMPVYQHSNLSDSSTDVEETFGGKQDIIGLGIRPDILQHRASTSPLSLTTVGDETLIFINVSQEGFDRLLAASYASDDIESVVGTLDSTELDDDYWPEFHYGDTSASEDPDMYRPPCTKEHDFADEKLDTSPSAPFQTSNPAKSFQSEEDFRDEFDTEVGILLSRIQTLPIGPLRPTSPTPTKPTVIGHHHPFPTLTHNPTTKTITISHTMDDHFDCPIFALGRHVAEVSSGPVPLLTRIHELQGVVEENRRGLRESRRYSIWWRVMVKDMGSPLRMHLSR